jgi:hypothetical protein
MAGLDPAIQASLQAAVRPMGWMAASRAAMTKRRMRGSQLGMWLVVE